MRIRELLEAVGVERFNGPEVEVQGISCHSMKVKEGDLFVAMRGMRHDGHDFLEEAIGRGAKAFLVEREVPCLDGRSYGVVEDTRRVLGPLSALFYGRPSEGLTLIGVTGTNGKTTTTYLIESVLRRGGKEVGVIGTVNYRYRGRTIRPDRTTPEAVDLQRILKEMVDKGVDHCVMEVSSHGMVMKRLLGCTFTCGVFTNLSQDHLDFHRDMDDYFEAKASFFTDLVEPSGGFSVINIDDPRGEAIARRVKGRRITYGLERGDVRIGEVELTREGISGILQTPKGSVFFDSSLMGRFNLYNIMAAVGVGIGLGLAPSLIGEGIGELKRVPGRMEGYLSPKGAMVIVDYAHTPDALINLLDALLPLKMGRLITVFGCGGDRDRTKRPLMGRVASERSDLVVITSDNPRSEDPKAIVEDIKRGINGGAPYHVELDRRKAIEEAILMGDKGDIVVIAGKGHEDYQIIGDKVLPFSDAEEVGKVFARMGKYEGPV